MSETKMNTVNEDILTAWNHLREIHRDLTNNQPRILGNSFTILHIELSMRSIFQAGIKLGIINPKYEPVYYFPADKKDDS